MISPGLAKGRGQAEAGSGKSGGGPGVNPSSLLSFNTAPPMERCYLDRTNPISTMKRLRESARIASEAKALTIHRVLPVVLIVE